jgi:hypothetical protein
VKRAREQSIHGNLSVLAFTLATSTRIIYCRFDAMAVGRQPMGAAAPLPAQHCQKVNDVSG